MPTPTEQILQEMYQSFLQELDKYLDKINLAFKQQPQSLVITKSSISPKELLTRVQNNRYLPSPYKITEEGIEFLFSSYEVYNKIKDSIPKSITSLQVPRDFLPNLEALQEYPNLTALEILYDQLTAEGFSYLATHTNIKNYYTTNMLGVSIDLDGKPHVIGIKAPIEKYRYQDITISEKNPTARTSTTLSAVIHDYHDLSELEKLIKDTDVSWADIDTIQIEDSENINKQKKSRWNSPFLKAKLNEEKQIEELEINIENYQAIEQILQEVIKRGYPIKKVMLHLQNRTDKDLENLEKYTEKLPIDVDYGSYVTAPLEDFAAMRSSIDWYKDIMSGRGLSPIEKVLYAYDLVKSFPYQASTENAEDSRYLDRIIKTGNIVCVGYSNLLSEILAEQGIRATPFSVMTQDEKGNGVGHSRTLLHLDDDKYNIHGLFTLDATWDSSRKELSSVTDKENLPQIRYMREQGDTITKEYDTLALYRNFLVPYEDYEAVYPKDTKPYIFRQVDYDRTTNKDNIDCPNDYMVEQECTSLFPNASWEEISSSVLATQKPSLETFTQILTTVREKEGYSTSNLTQEVNDVVELNQMIESLYEKPKTFFSSSQTKR